MLDYATLAYGSIIPLLVLNDAGSGHVRRTSGP
jgi:hypothetical protein